MTQLDMPHLDMLAPRRYAFETRSSRLERQEENPVALLIKNGEIVPPEGEAPGQRFRGDVRCQEGKIAEVGEGLAAAAGEEVLDASGLLVFPGGVDPHVHMSLPVAGTVSSDDFASGSAAALAGGTTTLIDFVHPRRGADARGGEDFLAALAARKAEAAPAVVDYGFHMAVTWWGDGAAAGMGRCVREGGIPTFKIYMAYRETVGLADEELIQVLATAGRLRAEHPEVRVFVHAEHGPVIEYLRGELAARGELGPESHPRSRPPETEGEATGRIATLAHLTGAQLYVVHVTCRESVEALARARRQGQAIHGETCPQYLLLDDSVYARPDFEGAAFVIAPPIRPRGHQDVLWEALGRGDLSVVATDHCPFNLRGQKELGREDFRLIPGGAGGVEHRLALLYTHGVRTGRLSVERFVELISAAPARLTGLYPRKGSLRPGSDADLVLWDPAATATISAATHRHHCDRSLYEGFEVTGLPVMVVAGGEIRYRQGDIRARPGCGRYLGRSGPGG